MLSTKTKSLRRNLCTLMKKLRVSDSKNSYKRLVNSERSETAQVQRGYVAMYVGEDRKRYQVPLEYLSSPKFQQLIKHSLEDDLLDVKVDGPIMLSCATQAFDQLLNIAQGCESLDR